MTIRYIYPEKDPFYEKPIGERIGYFEDGAECNHWLEIIVKAMAWHLFEHQEDWLYMAGELGEGTNPKLRGEDDITDKYRETDAITAFADEFDNQIAWLKNAVVTYMVRTCLHNDIDMSEDAIQLLFDAGYADELIDFHQLIPEWMKDK